LNPKREGVEAFGECGEEVTRGEVGGEGEAQSVVGRGCVVEDPNGAQEQRQGKGEHEEAKGFFSEGGRWGGQGGVAKEETRVEKQGEGGAYGVGEKQEQG
jgi:hypothetical protein